MLNQLTFQLGLITTIVGYILCMPSLIIKSTPMKIQVKFPLNHPTNHPENHPENHPAKHTVNHPVNHPSKRIE